MGRCFLVPPLVHHRSPRFAVFGGKSWIGLCLSFRRGAQIERGRGAMAFSLFLPATRFGIVASAPRRTTGPPSFRYRALCLKKSRIGNRAPPCLTRVLFILFFFRAIRRLHWRGKAERAISQSAILSPKAVVPRIPHALLRFRDCGCHIIGEKRICAPSIPRSDSKPQTSRAFRY